MGLVFREFDMARDFTLMAELWTRDNPDWPMNDAECRMIEHHQYRDKPLRRWVGELDGNGICMFGFGDQPWAHKEGRKFLSWHVAPESAHFALPMILDRGWVHAAESEAIEINLWMREGPTDRLEMLSKRGGRIVERLPHMRLTLSEFEPAPFQQSLDRVASAGIHIVTFRQLEEEGFDWKPQQYEVSCEIVGDIPAAQEATKPTYETFLDWIKDERVYDRSLMFAAIDKDQIVGYTRLQRSESNPRMLFTGLTGVVKSHRRQAIATAVKVHALLEMRKQGFEIVQTDNLDHNPMLEINKQLGFRPFCTFAHIVFDGPF